VTKRDAGPFDMIVRRALAEVWAEAYVMVHGSADCYESPCPHSIAMADLLEAVIRVTPQQQETDPATAALAN
jgi:hypothetical protein